MRVIRTDMYFSAQEIVGLDARRSGSRNPGFAAAWFKTDSSANVRWSNVENFVQIATVNHFDEANPSRFDSGDMRSIGVFQFIDLCVRNEPIVPNRTLPERIENRSAVDYILRSPIIVEHLPPIDVPFGHLIGSAAYISIGFYLGTHVVADGDPLMFVTAPGGIVIAGAAIGVSRGLMNGLNQAIEAAIKKILP
jgi:hypothetical protein